MSLITRCSACGTMFKVVADQLKVSEGWVRCGHCSEVFDAAAHLQPFTPDLPAPASPAGVAPSGTAESLAALDMLFAPDPGLLPGKEEAKEAKAPTSTPFVSEVQVPLPADLAADVFAFSVNPEPAEYAAGFPTTHEERLRLRSDEQHFDGSETPQENPAEQVSFVRDARRAAFWRRPLMQLVRVSGALVLLAVLLLQIAVFQRSTLAVMQPWTNPGLQALCRVLNCEISPPQQIESIVIDSSSFIKLANDAYRLKVVLRNTDTIELAMPALELTLTDSQDHATVRRVLTPAELGASAGTLAAGAEFSGVLALTVQNSVAAVSTTAAPSAPNPQTDRPLRIAGYRILVFYP
jgi:predicted Zn finger-like uncharacterized protein